MIRANVICAATLFLLGSMQLRAQQRVLVGPVAGYEFSVPLLLQRNAGAINYDPAFEGSGRSYSHSMIAGAHAVAPAAFSDLLGYSGRVALYATAANFTFDPYVPGLDLDSAATTIDPGRYREIAVDLTAATIVADAQFRIGIGHSYMAGLGLWGSARVSGQFTRTERPRLLPPDIDAEDATIVTGGSRIASHRYGYGAIASLGARVALSGRVTLMPELSSRLDAVALRKGMGTRSFTIGAGVSILFDASDDPIAARAMAPVGAIERQDTGRAQSGRLDVRVDLVADEGVDSLRGATLIAEDVVDRLYLGLPRVLPYDRHAFEPKGGFTFVSAEDARAFTTRSMAGLDLAGHYRHVLNILAYRMRGDAKTALTVTGIVTSDEPKHLGEVRAQMVRRYLIDVWGIDPSRIVARSARGESPSLVLDGSAALWQQPILSQWRTRRYRMPAVALDHEIVADAGVRRWTLEIAHGDRIVARYSSDSGAMNPSLDLRFAAGDKDESIPPIVATMTVEDSTGRVAVARDRMTVVKPQHVTTTSSHREQLSYVAFDESSDGASLRARQRAFARLAARALWNGASVTVAAIGNSRTPAQSDISRIAEDLLAAANERGVRIERFTALSEREVIAGMPDGVRILVEQSRAGAIDAEEAD